jgi:chorismate lyase/3-hydroxybenzoate synthase
MLLHIPLVSSMSSAWPLGLPVLGGEVAETIFPDLQPAGTSGDFTLYRSGDWLLGSATGRPDESPEAAAHRIYHDLLIAAADRPLARIWNYVPAINEPGHHGLENYQAFCRGRSLAFQDALGSAFTQKLPAASAVGLDSKNLAIIFAASPQPARHFENPRQVPAYAYPPEHGPRSPSFARATVVPRTAGRADVFISGTAAITGHATLAPGDTAAQLGHTLENLRTIGRTCGVGETLGAHQAAARHFKVYLRHAADYAAVAATLTAQLLATGDHVSYVRSDICRAALTVEIEVTLLDAPLLV